MGKILILVSLLPIAIYWLARRFLGDGVLAKHGAVDCRISGVDFAAKLSYTGKLRQRLQEGRQASVLAEIALLAAYEKLRAEQAQLVKWRITVDLWGRLVLPFSLLIATFGIMAGRPASWCIGLAMAVNAMVAVLKWTTRGVAHFAAEKAISMMSQARIPRQEDEAAVEACIRAWTWR
jgi:hypothetical protein